MHLVFTFTYYHLFPFAINLRLDYLWQIIQELMNVQQNSVHMSLQAWEILEILVKMGNLAEENFFFFGQKYQPYTKNEYLYTGIINAVFQRSTIFILHTSNRFFFFFEKNWSFSNISLFYFTLDMSLISSCVIYDTQLSFFPEIEKATFTN